MEQLLTFRQATMPDATSIWEIILQAKAQMYREGKQQWSEQYPSTQHIETDITRGHGHVLCRGNRIIAYGAVIFDGEPAYNNIEGTWLTLQPYVVVHRLAVADEAKRQGVAAHFMHEVEQLALRQNVHSFKVDTNYDNFYMQKLLKRAGFVYCGEISYPQGRRMGYEKLI